MAAFAAMDAEVERAKAKAGAGKRKTAGKRPQHGEHGERQRRMENGDG